MADKSVQSVKSIKEIARRVGRYPEAAYHFVREGLDHSVMAVHGPLTAAEHVVAQYMLVERIDYDEVLERRERGELDPAVVAALEEIGPQSLNRHVSGQDLCWGLRDLALHRWGRLASTVLRHWKITETRDFGRIVFALVEHELLQKEPHDSLDDFTAVYGFKEALDGTYLPGEALRS